MGTPVASLPATHRNSRQQEKWPAAPAASHFLELVKSECLASETSMGAASASNCAAMKSIIGVHSAAGEAATTSNRAAVESIVDVHSAAGEATSVTAIIGSACNISRPASPTPSRTAVNSAVPEPRRVSEVIPRTGTNEYAVHEIARSVVAVGSASVRIVGVISIAANRRTPNICRADGNSDRANTDSNSDPHLRLRIGQGNHHHRNQRHVLQVSHNHLPI